jgi:AAA+ superfamily predicted ATPase
MPYPWVSTSFFVRRTKFLQEQIVCSLRFNHVIALAPLAYCLNCVITGFVMEVSYRVLARKYRPQMFNDLVGQDALVTLLQNAIRLKRIPHAILLTGVRGVGKTTTAHVFWPELSTVLALKGTEKNPP